MDPGAAGLAAIGAASCCCCGWLLCAPGPSPASGAAAPPSPQDPRSFDLSRLREDVARAERTLQSEAAGSPPNQPQPAGQRPSAAATPGRSPHWQSRTTLLLGEEAMARLARSRVLLVGLGGVGGYVAEFLVRGGVGHLTIVDGDAVDPTNRNRQLVALRSTEGQPKSAVLADRLRDINPEAQVTPRHEFVPADPAAVDALVASDSFDFVVDCIDSLQPKVELIRAALKHRVRVVSSMGAGGRLDPAAVIVADLSQMQWERAAIRTAKRAGNRKAAGPVAHEKLGGHVRKRLSSQYGIEGGVTVVTSEEVPRKAFELTPDKSKHKASYYGTWACLPAAFGLHAASVVLRALSVEGGGMNKKQRQLRKAAEYAAGAR